MPAPTNPHDVQDASWQGVGDGFFPLRARRRGAGGLYRFSTIQALRKYFKQARVRLCV